MIHYNRDIGLGVLGFWGFGVQMIKKIRNTIRSLMRIHNKNWKREISKALHRWKSTSIAIKLYMKKKKKEKDIEEKYSTQLAKKKQEYDLMQKKIKEKEIELNNMKETEGKMKEVLKEKESKEIELSKTLDKLKKGETEDHKVPHSSGRLDDIAPRLEGRIKALEKENKGLKEQMSYTEANVTDFATEMNEFLDSIEFPRMII